ncbi:MAG: NAD(P)/FAD-dependent oxidoreductase [Methyloceanibacter sp.]
MTDTYDVAIVGGGAAGLSAAIVLGRCRRHVVLIDAGITRNRTSQAVHCLLGHEGKAPSELVAMGRREIERYSTVTQRSDSVTAIARSGNCFSIECQTEQPLQVRKVLLTTGLTDDLPPVEGVNSLYGRSVHHCPYCDGYEYRDQAIAVYGEGDEGGGLALMMKQWSSDVLLFTNGLSPVSAGMLARLQQHGVGVCTERITKLEGTPDGRLTEIRLESGQAIARDAMFFTTGCHQSSELSATLGCIRDEKGGIVTDPVTEESSVSGVYVAGDASRDVLLVAVAIGEGAKAGVAINRALLKEDGLG